MTNNPALDEMQISLRLADDRISDVLDRQPERLAALREIAAPFLGDQTAREQQLAAVLRKAEELSGAITADRSTLGRAQQELAETRDDIGRAGSALAAAGPDEAASGRLASLRNATDETSEHLSRADARLDQVQQGLAVLGNEQRLSPGMDSFDQSKGVAEVGRQGAEDLGVATEALRDGRQQIGQIAADQDLLIAQKGLNPTGRADQHIVADQGSSDLAARINGISAALDGWDR